jgi:hypothetical protein
MQPRLGEILVEEGACTAAIVRQALQNQAIFGGRLGTNLLELGAVREDVLAFALGRLTGSPALYGDLPPDPKALSLLDRKLVERWEVVPYLVADRRLAVLARDPRDLNMLDEISFATGKSVQAFVVPEARLWRTMARSYGIDREHRGIDLEGVPRPTPPPLGALAPAADLIDEADFEELYGQIGMTPTPVPGTLPSMPPARAASPGSSEPLESLEPVEEEAAALPAGPAAEAAAVRAAEPHPAAVPPLSLEILDALAAAPERPAPPPPQFPPPVESPPVTTVEPSPLTFDEAVRFLEGLEDREAIAQTVLRYARSRFARAVLFTVKGAEAHGWAGLGGGLTSGLVHRIRLPLGVPGVVDTVVKNQGPTVGPLGKTWANIRLLKGLGGGVPTNAVLVPVLALGRVVNVLYCDAGRGQAVGEVDVSELVILSARIARSYDHLAARAG